MITNILLGLTCLLLLLILLVLGGIEYRGANFAAKWQSDYQKRQRDIEHVLRLIVVHRRAREAEGVGHLINSELLEAMENREWEPKD